MKHFRLAFCFLAASSVALLLIALARQPVDPTEGRRQSVPVSQVAPDSSPAVAAAPASAESDRSATSTEGQKDSPAAPESEPAPVPANGDDEPRHPGDRVDAATIARRYGNQPLTETHPAMAAAIEVQERNNRWLLANPAVVGTGVGLNDAGDVAIIVYTKIDAPELPKAIESIPVAVWRSGEFHARLRTQEEATKVKDDGNARAKSNAGKPGGTTVDPTARFERAVPIGVSTGHPAITAGTIGCRVKDGNGNVFALSNNHVYADQNKAQLGDNALQPGAYDGGHAPADVIATLYDFQPLDFVNSNTMDAAIALSSTSNLGQATPSNGYGKPKSTPIAAAVGMPVKKYGRTTGPTSSKVSSINVSVRVGYDDNLVALFTGQVYFSGHGFSAGGDSGSLIVGSGGTNERKPVGLLFAGSNNSTIANPIGLVLSRFGVSIDGE